MMRIDHDKVTNQPRVKRLGAIRVVVKDNDGLCECPSCHTKFKPTDPPIHPLYAEIRDIALQTAAACTPRVRVVDTYES